MTSSAPETGAENRFQAFDDAIRRDTSLPDPRGFEESISRLQALVDRLPQRPAIEARNAVRWVDRTVAMAVKRMEVEHGEAATVGHVHGHALWHLRRASAIGGSEIGTVLRHFRGETGGFGNAHNLVLEKLLVLSPMPGTPEMERGNRAEPWLQRMYHEGRGVATDREGLDRLRGFRWGRLPQIVGTPDDIVLEGGTRKLVDYKCPSADVAADYARSGISFDYVAQVHHYNILAQAAGTAIDAMEVAVFDARHFRIVSYPVPWDRDLAREMLQGARRIWNDHVMTGSAPDTIGPDALDTDNPDIRDMAAQVSVMKVVAEEFGTRQAEMLKRIYAMGSEWHEVSTGRLDLGFANIERQRAWKEDILEDLAARAGIDVADFRVSTDKLDADRAEAHLKAILEGLGQTDASLQRALDALADEGLPMKSRLDAERLVEHLEAIGVDPMEAADVKERFSLTRKKKGSEAEILRGIRMEAIDLVDSIEETLEEAAPRLARGEREELPDGP